LAAIVLAAVRGRHVGGRGEVRDGRAGKGVRRAGVVDVGVIDARVGVAVGTREGDGLIGRARLRPANTDLRAGRVKLGAARGTAVLERNDLVSDEIVARRNLCWDGKGYGIAVR
jgi:hypothetical protein